VPNFLDGLGRAWKGCGIGLPRHLFAEAKDVSAEVVSGDRPSRGDARKASAVVEEIALAGLRLFNACGRVIMYARPSPIHEQATKRDTRFRIADVFAIRLAPSSPRDLHQGDAVASRTVASGPICSSRNMTR